jgi:hypothetical protein
MISKDWSQIREALKRGGAELHVGNGPHWLVMPIDSRFAREILSHPAIENGGTYRIGTTDYWRYRWRSESPGGKALRALKTQAESAQ